MEKFGKDGKRFEKLGKVWKCLEKLSFSLCLSGQNSSILIIVKASHYLITQLLRLGSSSLALDARHLEA